jgi:hypothetical protein
MKKTTDRRTFLQYSTALATTGGLAAPAAQAQSQQQAQPVQQIVQQPSGQTPTLATATVDLGRPLGLFTGAMQFTLLGTRTLKAPFTLGFAFKRGDIPAGSTVAGSTGALQVTPRSTWPDGSLKFAQLSGLASISGGVPTTCRLTRSTTPLTGTALTPADLRRTAATAVVDCGTFGRASFALDDWLTPFQTWISGPLMSSWVFRKPVGTDPHLVAWLEVRLFADGSVEVLPWIENGYLMVAAPTSKSAAYSFFLGGTQRFSSYINLAHHQRTVLISGTYLSHWLGADPTVIPRVDLNYLQATELVPNYGARPSTTTATVTSLASSFTPLQIGNFKYDSDYMPATGYQEPIGLLPQADVMYLTVDASNIYHSLVRNGYSAGRYPIHYRDEKTQRPIRFSQYPTLVLNGGSAVKDAGGSTASNYTPKPTGIAPPVWDCAHSPSVGYLAYLTTGYWYFMEEVQFSATANYLTKSDIKEMRRGSLGLVQTAIQAWQTRSCAWDWRSLIQALTVTPDTDTVLRNELIACVENNINFFHNTYIVQPNNPWGWILPGETYNDSLQIGAPWQQDFVTAVFGYALSLGLPLSATGASKLDTFFRWKAKSVVMRLGPSTGFWYINADPYNMIISPVNRPDFETGKGPWLTTEAAVYAKTYTTKPAWLGSTEGKLAGEFGTGERSYWGNLLPALAYAVRHGVTGAAEGFDRIVHASNYPALRDAFNIYPVWSVMPPRITPAWMVGKQVNEWFEIPGTAGAGGAAIEAFSGIAFNDRSNEILIAAAGGHTDSADNRVVSLALASDAPKWVQRMAPSAGISRDVAYYADGKPTARHLYSSAHFVPQVNRLMLFGLRASYGAAFNFAKIDAFNLDTNTWDPAGTWKDMPVGVYGAAMIPTTGEIVDNGLNRWSPYTKLWTPMVTARTADAVRAPISFDSKRNQLFTLQWGDGQGYDPYKLSASRVPLSGTAQISVTFKPSVALNQFLSDQPTYAGMDYDPENDRFLFYCGMGAGAGRIYVIKPNDTNVWDMSILTLGAGSVKVAPTGIGGVHNRFRYVAALRGFVLLATGASNLYFIRTS